MHRRRITTALLTTTLVAWPMSGAVSAAQDDGPATVRVVAPATPQHWDPLTDELWAYEGDQVVLTRAGTNPNDGVRRPFEYAVVTKGPELADVSVRAEVRLDESVAVSNRDVVVIWNYQGPKRFYYAHFSQDNTIYPHNGIFVVDNADRRRIDDQWTGSVGAPPAVTDADWHDVRVDHDATTGEIEVYVDGADEPLMTATDTTFSGGRVGFGSFDNFGRTRHFRAVGTPASSRTP
jgi:hypothetical protein